MLLTEAEALAALPTQGFLKRYVDYAFKSTDSHVAYHILNGLGILTQIVPEHIHYRFGAEPIYSNIFGLIVAPSSISRKSVSMRMSREIIKSGQGTVMEIPASKEALITMLCEKPKQILLYPEFGSFLAASENSHLTAIKTVLNDVFDGQALSHVTVGSKRGGGKLAHVENPRMTLIGACDPNYLSRHTEMVDWESGFFARFFCIYALRERTYDEPQNLPAERESLIDAFKMLMEKGKHAHPRAYCRGLSNSARAIWKPWVKSVEDRISTSPFKPALARAGTLALKIATLLACDYGNALIDESWEITPSMLIPAIRITELHIKSATSVSRFVSSDKNMMDRARVLSLIEPTPKPRSDLLRESKLLRRQFNEIIATLVEEKTIEQSSSATNANEAHYRLTDVYLANLQSHSQSLQTVPPMPALPGSFPNTTSQHSTPNGHSSIGTKQNTLATPATAKVAPNKPRWSWI